MSRRNGSSVSVSGEVAARIVPPADCAHCGSKFTKTNGHQKFCVPCRDQELRRRGITKADRLGQHAAKMRERAKKARAKALTENSRSFWATATDEQRLAHQLAGWWSRLSDHERAEWLLEKARTI